ncbi:hypothetical protein WJ972_21315 [Achromobacter insuavis]
MDKGLGTLFRPIVEDVAFQSLRGQVHELRLRLDDVAPAQRETVLREQVRPYYGLRLQLLRQDAVQLNEDEREQLEILGFVMRDEYSTHLVPLPGQPAQWLEVRLPGEGLVDTLLTWGVWVFLGFMMAMSLLALWALPMWRDMDALRNAALRMGQGELSMRVHLSRISGIRHVGESFNTMAERIAALVDNQRSLTNAVSHELRTRWRGCRSKWTSWTGAACRPAMAGCCATCARTSPSWKAWWRNCWCTPGWNGPPRKPCSSRRWTRATGWARRWRRWRTRLRRAMCAAWWRRTRRRTCA